MSEETESPLGNRPAKEAEAIEEAAIEKLHGWLGAILYLTRPVSGESRGAMVLANRVIRLASEEGRSAGELSADLLECAEAALSLFERVDEHVNEIMGLGASNG